MSGHRRNAAREGVKQVTRAAPGPAIADFKFQRRSDQSTLPSQIPIRNKFTPSTRTVGFTRALTYRQVSATRTALARRGTSRRFVPPALKDGATLIPPLRGDPQALNALAREKGIPEPWERRPGLFRGMSTQTVVAKLKSSSES